MLQAEVLRRRVPRRQTTGRRRRVRESERQVRIAARSALSDRSGTSRARRRPLLGCALQAPSPPPSTRAAARQMCRHYRDEWRKNASIKIKTAQIHRRHPRVQVSAAEQRISHCCVRSHLELSVLSAPAQREATINAPDAARNALLQSHSTTRNVQREVLPATQRTQHTISQLTSPPLSTRVGRQTAALLAV